ncbi:hypothetical protein [Aureimonas sp. ME7]|uniref:hypothetical protein n=1 Tax=Aureimonas sp. ME7 TaxID=2744252 RepID=UPI0015F4568A|nr:hypothetical protein [Aureimonas sp. ME7]
MIVLPSRRIVASLALVLASATSSLAADAQAFADRLKAVMGEQNVTLETGTPASEGDDVVLPEVRVRGNQPGEDPVALGDLHFEGVTGSTPDGWKATRVAPADIDRTDGDMRTQIGGIAVEGLTIQGTNATTKALSPIFFERASIASVAAERNGKSVLSVENIDLKNEGAEGEAYRTTFGVGSFTADTAGDQPASSTLKELGYETLTGNMSGNASWDPKSGALTLDPLQVVVNDAGKLDFSYTITGYTPSFIQSLSQMSEQMKASGGQSEGSGMAVIGLLSQLNLQSANLSFADDSLTNRVLDYFAKQNNQTREQMVSGVLGSLPLALGYLQNPQFQADVTAAVKSFLENPEQLTIAIAPPSAVPVTQIMGAAMGAPQTLPQVLNLSVKSGG